MTPYRKLLILQRRKEAVEQQLFSPFYDSIKETKSFLFLDSVFIIKVNFN
jgi:hypothetical protein